MSNKAELIEQLRKCRDFAYERFFAKHEILKIDDEIAKLNKQSLSGVPYQQWWPTDHAVKVSKELEKEKEQTKNEKLAPYKTRIILSIIIPAVIGFVMFVGGGVGNSVAVTLLGFLLIALTYPLFGRPAVNARRRAAEETIEMTASQYSRLQQAKLMDENNTQLNKQKKAELDAELRKKNDARIKELQIERSKQQTIKWECERELKKGNLYEDKDQDPGTVSALIKILESNRADTLQAAFHIFDEQQHREQMLKEQREARLAQQRMQEKMLHQMEEEEKHRQQEAEQARQDQLRREREMAEHYREMERLQQKQIDELERKRKADDDYRRSGYVEGNW